MSNSKIIASPPRTNTSAIPRSRDKLGEHYACDPATLNEDQLRAYFLFLRQEKKFGGSAMKLARCSLRSFFRNCLRIEGWTVFEEEGNNAAR